MSLTDPNPEADPLEDLSIFHGVRGTAVKILTRIERTDAYLDKLLDAEMVNNDFNPLDKRLLNEIVHGVLRNQAKIDWVLTGFYHGQYSKVMPNVRNALRIAVYQLLFLTRIPHHAAVNEAVEFVKRDRGQELADTVNGLLRNIARNVENIRYPLASNDEIQYLSVVYSHPTWLVKRWHARFGFETTESICKANNVRPFITLRHNSLKTRFPDFISALVERNIDFRNCFFLNDFVTIRNLPNLRQLDMFQDGQFSIQDESAGLVVKLLNPQPGQTVLDLCAAPGGKSLFAAEMMGNQGRVISVDKYLTRLGFVMQSAERLGISIVEPLEADAIELKMDPVDAVLVDAPCSGLGTLSKKPDIKWRREMDDILKLTELQRSILENASTLVRPGGVLLYSTCTMEPEENGQIVKAFLAVHPEFEIDPAGKYLQQQLVGRDGFMETFPNRHHMDGAFGARMIRKS
jgi:16S rRNA (cytosine967-C5)-methyltransferase